jgi:hypothetical protein
MKNADRNKIIDTFLKWYGKFRNNAFTYEEEKLVKYYGYEKEGAHNLISFWAGYKNAKKESERAIVKTNKDGLTCGIAYSIGLLNKYYGKGAAEFLLNESGLKSITELKAAGCEQFDIDNIGDLLPEETEVKENEKN